MKAHREISLKSVTVIVVVILFFEAGAWAAESPEDLQKHGSNTFSFFESVTTAIKQNGEQIVTLLTFVFGGALTWALAKARKLKRRLAGPRFGLPPEQKEKLNRVLLLGIGGTGKTSLIQSLTCNSEANPRIKTLTVHTYSFVFEVIEETLATVCRIDIDDYPGQNVGHLVKEIVNPSDDRERFPITSVVLVVDLFSPGKFDERLSPSDRWSKQRVSENTSTWSDEAMSAVLGLATKRPKLICLFINKVDMLSTITGETEGEIRKAYEKLIDRLAMRSAGMRLEVLVGSAKDGLKVATLMRLLIQESQPLEELKDA